jgi:hypothetical protein
MPPVAMILIPARPAMNAVDDTVVAPSSPRAMTNGRSRVATFQGPLDRRPDTAPRSMGQTAKVVVLDADDGPAAEEADDRGLGAGLPDGGGLRLSRLQVGGRREPVGQHIGLEGDHRRGAGHAIGHDQGVFHAHSSAAAGSR